MSPDALPGKGASTLRFSPCHGAFAASNFTTVSRTRFLKHITTEVTPQLPSGVNTTRHFGVHGAVEV